MAKDFRIFLKGEELTDDIIRYQKVGSRYNVIFKNGKQYTYSAYNVKIIESALKDKNSKACFEYLKEIADEIGIVYKGKNLLSSSYNKIKFIDKESMLAKFISKNLSGKKELLKSNIIYPFGFNKSQAIATNNALLNELSIIQGPPGTGKTQTILNIIANIVMSKQSVAVVSSNNSAIQNVLDKLKKYDVDFIAAFLGKLENKQEFINSQTDLPNIDNWKIDKEQIAELNEKLENEYQILQEKLDIQNDLAKLKQELSNVEIEHKHFDEYYKTIEIKQDPKCIYEAKSSLKMLDMIYACETFQEIHHENIFVKLLLIIFEYLKFWDRKRLILHNLTKRNEYTVDFLKIQFQRKFYELRIRELEFDIQNLKNHLKDYNFEEKMKKYADLSAKIFKHCLYEKYLNNNRDKYTLDELKTKSQKFINDYPVILSTTYSLKNCLSNEVIYDYVIIDEASQVDLCTGALALACAKKAVIVGDLKQLPNVVKVKSQEVLIIYFHLINLMNAIVIKIIVFYHQ